MTDFFDLIHFEEGFRSRPYLCSEGYPTVGYGFRLGAKYNPKCGIAFADLYDFTLPEPAARAWLMQFTGDMIGEMTRVPSILAALQRVYGAKLVPGEKLMNLTDNPRASVLLSMAFQLGVGGLAKFRYTLDDVSNGDFGGAAARMLESRWAKQTPNRAKRHSIQLHTGLWVRDYRK